MKTKFIFLKGNIILNAPMFARVKLERNLFKKKIKNWKGIYFSLNAL